ncbi:arylamine N-acetyltransferase 1 isoform X3 [Bubalus kerabau]|uniref:arylamine N-acetyltransferase 1 isoform X3 n=1 Tax=Bubalus bubalis TaxID=89462 RepID=UPI000DBC8036|nr:arylamine N-acetyltransferase 1 isoform X3 [Bubalus bubalis]XP_044781716.1 arylamine N-acetyltransferase 1 isoform X3 [Bubalus bubalis]XP_055422917.1 arylamine N-acetyltransferase 1 isoform X3 [Bubalus carabanensis]
MNIEAYFERIGYKNSRDKLDLETLTDILQHQIQAIPFENLNIHCGEAMELDLEVTIDGRDYIADAGFGRSYQMWQPLELISGKYQPQTPCIFRLTEDRGTWYLDQIRREQYIPNQDFLDSDLLEKNEYRKIYSFTLEPRTIKDFESVNTYLQESPASVFTSKSFCSLQTPEGVHCLVGFTLTYRRFNYKDNTDLVEFKTLNEKEIEENLKNIFNISLEKKLTPKHGDKFFTI